MKNVIIGVSGGPDSMALLDMYKDKYHVTVAHVNYQKRETAFLDELLVKDYCEKNNIKIECAYPKITKGNFQAEAREYRYKFYQELADKYQADTVMVGHHLQDHLETYLLQLGRKAIVDYYGLQTETNIQNIKVYRPLLKYHKSDLIEYCQNNNVPYNIDESNLSKDYQRNSLRIDKINKLNTKEIESLLLEISEKNKELKNKKERLINITNDLKDSRTTYQELELDDQLAVLYQFLKGNGYYNISKDYASEIVRQLLNKEFFKFEDKYLVLKDARALEFRQPYTTVINKIEFKDYGRFIIDDKGEVIEGLKLSPEDLPITIRSWKEKDKIKLKFGTKKVSRFLIDRKIKPQDKIEWLVVENVAGEIIFVDKLGCDLKHYSANPSIYIKKERAS